MTSYYSVSNGGNCREHRECSATASDYAPVCECPACKSLRDRRALADLCEMERLVGVVAEFNSKTNSVETRV